MYIKYYYTIQGHLHKGDSESMALNVALDISSEELCHLKYQMWEIVISPVKNNDLFILFSRVCKPLYLVYFFLTIH